MNVKFSNLEFLILLPLLYDLHNGIGWLLIDYYA